MNIDWKTRKTQTLPGLLGLAVRLWRSRVHRSVCVLIAVSLSLGSTIVPVRAAVDFEKQIKPILTAHCAKCHSGQKPKGDMSIGTLNPDFVNGPDLNRWHAVLDAINSAEMPPEDQKQLTNTHRHLLVRWLTDGMRRAVEVGRGKIEPVIRRLNRNQYNNTLQDLLHLGVNLNQDLPADALSGEGFTNNGAELNLSALHLEYYMKIARTALDKAIFLEPKPTIHHFRVEFGKSISPGINPKKQRVHLGYAAQILAPEDFRYSEPAITKPFDFVPYKRRTKYTFNEGYNGNATIKGLKSFDDIFHSVFVDFRGGKGKFELLKDGVDLQPARERGNKRSPTMKVAIREYPLEGDFVVRVKASRIPEGGDTDPGLVAYIGVRRDDGEGFTAIGPAQTVSSTKPQVFEFHGRLEEMTLPSYEIDNDHYLGNLMHVGVWNEPLRTSSKTRLKIHSIDFEAPYFTTWPPPSHKSIFIDSRNREDQAKYAQEIIAEFLTRAYRRPATDSELQLLVGFWKQIAQEQPVFEDSIKETLVIALSSPQFLYIHEPAKQSRALTDYELAARLSYFLWNSMPDRELLNLAAKRQLVRNLDKQVERMIQDDKSWRFVSEFADQWLDVSRMDRTVVYKRREYTDELKTDMKLETAHFVNEVLQKNQSVLDFVDSDFVMINNNLAKLYGVKNVAGRHFRRVAIGSNSQRGGVLTHASILTGHSSGRDSNPVKRGVWFSKKILGNPPPNPPPGVPPLDEENPKLNKMTLKKQLELHRNDAACIDCHRKIDPWGIAFEKYDTIGKFRAEDRAHEAAATLPGGHQVDGLRDLKNYIRQYKKTDVARSVVRHLATYALGRSLSFADANAVDQIVTSTAVDDYRLRDIVRALVKSKPFLSR